VPVVILVADGLRPDTLAAAIDGGNVPALARLREEGGLNTVTSVFPSVTGPAYAPFLMGRFPGSVGLPGLRWYDRTRKLARMPFHSRSYVGAEMRHVDSDLDAAAPTIFERVPSSLAAMNVIGRGLKPHERLGQGLRFVVRTGVTHFRGDVRGWLAIDRDVAEEFTKRFFEDRPAFAFAALTGIDKTSHARGHESSLAAQALSIVDLSVGSLRYAAERAGIWEETHLWVVSDHGHSPVSHHEDLAAFVESLGVSVIAHPWPMRASPESAVMVSGNAMAHIYTGLRDENARHEQAEMIAAQLLERQSVDLLLRPCSGGCDVYSASRGKGQVTWDEKSYSYQPQTGDPLGIGPVTHLSNDAAYQVTRGSEYPDSLVQIANLTGSSRCGDIVLSAAPGWDFRARFEPIPHVSTHGSLRREHMLVPLLTNRAPKSSPRRTTDVMPSALAALGLEIPGSLDGQSFI
jgi:hypothetical protein